LPWGRLRHIPVQIYLDCQFPYSFSLCLVSFPCIEKSLKQLNRISSHIPVQFVVPSSHYAVNLYSVNTSVCSTRHMVHYCRNCLVSSYDRRQLSMSNVNIDLSSTNIATMFCNFFCNLSMVLFGITFFVFRQSRPTYLCSAPPRTSNAVIPVGATAWTTYLSSRWWSEF
jgi:hypothetical protein